jgi:hypothetical protein
VRADKPRRQAGIRDMLLSLGVIFAFIALGWPAFVNREGTSIRTVDVAESVAAASSSLTFPLLVPQGLPADWLPTSAYVNTPPATGFHIGYYTPAHLYAAVEQTNVPAADALRVALGDGSVPRDTAVIAGNQWELRDTATRAHALVRTADGRTVVVLGTADWPELQTLAASLH